MGLLDSIDPQILALLQGPTADNAASDKNMGLMVAGLDMMQHAYLNPVVAFGHGGLIGLDARNQSAALRAQQAAQRMGMFGQAMNLQNQLQTFQDNAAIRQKMAGFAGRFGVPGSSPQAEPPADAPSAAPPSGAPPSAAPYSAPSGPWQPGMPVPPQPPSNYVMKTTGDGIPYMAPPDGVQVASNAPVSIPSSPQSPPPATNVPAKPQKYELYQQMGDYWMANGEGNPKAMELAQHYYDLAEKFRPKPVGEPRAVTMNGQRVMVQSYDSGPPQIQPFGPDADKPELVDTGAAKVAMDPRTLQPIPGVPPIPKELSPSDAANLRIKTIEADPLGLLGLNNGSGPGAPTGQPGQLAGASKTGTPIASDTHGQDLLDQLKQPIADQVKALSEGRMAFPAGFALKSPYWQSMISLVSQYDPSFDAINYNARAAMRKNATSGPIANNLTALNTAIAHASSLDQAFKNLNNFGGIATPLNAPINYIEQAFGDPRQKDVQIKTEAVANELAKVFRQSGMSQGEISRWLDTISPNMSPAQQQVVLKSALDLMEGRMQAIADTYNKGMGTTATPLELLSPTAQVAFTRLRGSPSDVTTSATSANAGPLVKNTTALYKAQQAIKQGADPEAVKARLKAAGVDPSGL